MWLRGGGKGLGARRWNQMHGMKMDGGMCEGLGGLKGEGAA